MARLIIYAMTAAPRFTGAVRSAWKRILVFALIGWACSVIGGAFALIALESRELISLDTSDAIGMVIPPVGLFGGAIFGWESRKNLRRQMT